MSLQRVIKSLIGLGLSQTDANVYIYLAVYGPLKAEKIGDALKLKERLLYQSLEKLKSKGLVSSFLKQSVLISALPFDKTLELLVEQQLRAADTIEQEKTAIISKGRTII
jgi:HTH-type transcriptional regulator, sugar sensing transcriptional regulator